MCTWIKLVGLILDDSRGTQTDSGSQAEQGRLLLVSEQVKVEHGGTGSHECGKDAGRGTGGSTPGFGSGL